MHPSVQTLVLALVTLAIAGVEGFQLRKRADPVDTSSAQGAQNVLITDSGQNYFYTPMQFGSGNGVVSTYGLVSTTSGDIFLPGTHAKNLTGFVSQGKSVAEGPIYAGPVSAGGWTVPDQDIVYYENSGAVLPITVDGDFAYAGFGIWPNTSTIAQAFGDWSADSLIARIAAEPNAGPYWTLLIHPFESDRGTDQSFGGVLSIGELVNLTQIFNVTEEDLEKAHVPNLSLITGYPPLNHDGVYNGTSYYALIDSISWASGSATLNSTVPGTPSGKISAYLDSTDPWIYAPYYITEQLYKSLANATYVKDTGLWHFTCTELTIDITIAGYSYPLSPLTAVEHIESSNCVGNFRAKPDDAGGDIVLGVPFLKNVYARFAYQTLRDGEVFDPYVQLMPVTDVEDAHNEWVNASSTWGSSPQPSSVSVASHPTPTPSLLSTPPSSSPSVSTPPPSSPSPSSSASDPVASGGSDDIAGAVEGNSKSGNSTKKKSKVGRYLAVIVAVVVVVALGIIGCIVFIVLRKRKGRDGKGSYRGLGKPEDDSGPVQVPLYDSEGGSDRYGEGGQGRYTDPYKDG